MQEVPFPERLTLAEIEFCLLGNSPETIAWNQGFAMLIDEYRTALLDEDEGWASDKLCEVRKCLGRLDEAVTYDMGDIAAWLEEGRERE